VLASKTGAFLKFRHFLQKQALFLNSGAISKSGLFLKSGVFQNRRFPQIRHFLPIMHFLTKRARFWRPSIDYRNQEKTVDEQIWYLVNKEENFAKVQFSPKIFKR
jgi:hypothetical protein